MAEISKRYTVTYRWWNNEIESISPEHQAELDEYAERRTAEMLKEGYTSGELNETLHVYGTAYDIEYRGWWEKKTTEVAHVSFPPSQP